MVTMRQVAAEAGVSYTTVSFVINGNDTARGIGAATRERVLETAKRLGYRHNGLARAVSTGKSQVLAVAVQTLELEFRARILSGVLEAAEAAGYFVKVVALPETEIPREKIEQLVEARVAGVIAVNIEAESLNRLRKEMGRYGGLVATVDDVNPQDCGIRISSDNAGGIRASFEHLRELGHDKIALLSGPLASPIVQARRGAFAQLSRQHALTEFPFVEAAQDWTLLGADVEPLRALLASAERPTALICMSDLLAMRAIKIARALGLQVPRDLSVVGYGDFAIAEIADPALSTVAQPFQGMGHLAATHLLNALGATESKSAPNAQLKTRNSAATISEILPTHFIARESSGPVPPTSRSQAPYSVKTP